ncbi:hypothetical protein FHG87_015172 [Trinorchestia longiramus]|nr:hypothetical protein FHG87_015172 [Trinorchestia longiramus]
MVTLQVRLFALIVPRTVVILAPVETFGCPKAVKARFNKLKDRGPDSDVVYQRVTVTEERLQYAPNMTVDLPSANVVECARAAARESLDAFVFDGNCTGYQLGASLFKCNTDSLVIFVRLEKLADEAAVLSLVVPFDGKKMPMYFYKSEDKLRSDAYYKTLRCHVLPWLKANYPSSGSQTFSDHLPLGGPVQSPGTTWFQRN